MLNKSEIIKKVFYMLDKSPLKLTSQRKQLINLIYSEGHCHFTAEDVYRKAKKNKIKISLATVYNNLNSFKNYGMLNVVRASSDKIYFDTNLDNHHHFYIEKSGKLLDINNDQVIIQKLPKSPKGYNIKNVTVVINLEE
ncbi:MAG: hypothetical protein CMP25_00905 [Rickettsiales bacterium]|nr:hypothetical protein [Rickettsiales bacterium]|tara:strand:+ start:1455 stop:1871 length:417 start_codon:yes stop_codon:yes gene_type:complete